MSLNVHSLLTRGQTFDCLTDEEFFERPLLLDEWSLRLRSAWLRVCSGRQGRRGLREQCALYLFIHYGQAYK